jgi:hypothetical protein
LRDQVERFLAGAGLARQGETRGFDHRRGDAAKSGAVIDDEHSHGARRLGIGSHYVRLRPGRIIFPLWQSAVHVPLLPT